MAVSIVLCWASVFDSKPCIRRNSALFRNDIGAPNALYIKSEIEQIDAQFIA